MVEEKLSKEICSFSQSNLQRFIANHLDKFAWACIVFIIAFTIIRVGHFSIYGIILLVFLCFIPILYARIHQKFAYEIIMDFKSRKVTLHMYRSEAIITTIFDDIKSIRVNGYIIFVLKERKVFYSDLQKSELFSCLNKIMQIDWGPLCALWGPSKGVREALSRDKSGEYPERS